MRQALGTAVFFGMLGVTGFGLIFTPVFYIVIRRLVTWLNRHRPACAPSPSRWCTARPAAAGERRRISNVPPRSRSPLYSSER